MTVQADPTACVVKNGPWSGSDQDDCELTTVRERPKVNNPGGSRGKQPGGGGVIMSAFRIAACKKLVSRGEL